MSVAIGVLVRSTVDMARNHADHGSKSAVKQDEDIIRTLCNFFEATLMIEEKPALQFRDFEDAMLMPQVQMAFKNLDLPVTNIKDLFNHLDKRRREEVTVEEFEKGILLLKRPASRFDV